MDLQLFTRFLKSEPEHAEKASLNFNFQRSLPVPYDVDLRGIEE